MNTTLEPVQPLRLPSPSEVHAHIGHLLRELHRARRLLKLSQEYHGPRGDDAGGPQSREVPHAR